MNAYQALYGLIIFNLCVYCMECPPGVERCPIGCWQAPCKTNTVGKQVRQRADAIDTTPIYKPTEADLRWNKTRGGIRKWMRMQGSFLPTNL